MFMGYKMKGGEGVKKIGRPTNNPKGTPIHVRLDATSYEILARYTKQNNVSRAEAIRQGIKKLDSDTKK